jgi:hemerythrin
MEEIVWSEEWVLDHDVIDGQHKRLVKLLNGIIKSDIAISRLMSELIDYASRHFTDEEEIMFTNNYPDEDYYHHKEEHRKFKETLLDISFEVIKYNDSNKELVAKIKSKFEEFCFFWFHSHFLETDRKVVEFLKGGRLNNKE